MGAPTSPKRGKLALGIIELGVLHKFIEKSGAWYSYNGDRIGQGKDNVREFLRANPAMAREIENKVRVACAMPELAVIAADSKADAA